MNDILRPYFTNLHLHMHGLLLVYECMYSNIAHTNIMGEIMHTESQN